MFKVLEKNCSTGHFPVCQCSSCCWQQQARLRTAEVKVLPILWWWLCLRVKKLLMLWNFWNDDKWFCNALKAVLSLWTRPTRVENILEGNLWAHKQVEEADFGLCGWQIGIFVTSIQWNLLCCQAAVQNIPKMGFSLSEKRQAMQILGNLETA